MTDQQKITAAMFGGALLGIPLGMLIMNLIAWYWGISLP